MSQHDYVIANGTGAAVRSDLNNALSAIVSQNSGATEPATMYAYQWWADTTTGLLKIRNAANNAWVTVGTLASANLGLLSSGGTVTAALGSASTPGITFTGDTNTGIYSPGADQVAISTNGSGRLFVDSSGRVLAGTSSTSSTALLQVQGNSSSATGDAIIQLRRGENNASILNGESLGSIQFSNSESSVSAVIEAVADANWNTTNDYPSRLTFSTTADGASSPTERMKLLSTGQLNCIGVYNDTTAVAANVYVASSGNILRSTSSSKYKTNIETIDCSYSDKLLDCRPVWYRSTCNEDNPAWGWWGFIAEEVAKVDPRLVHWKTVEITYDEKGSAVETPCEPEPEGVQYDRFVPHLLNLIKRQKEQIEAMEARLTAAGIA